MCALAWYAHVLYCCAFASWLQVCWRNLHTGDLSFMQLGFRLWGALVYGATRVPKSSMCKYNVLEHVPMLQHV
jgi:hypothetical protein